MRGECFLKFVHKGIDHFFHDAFPVSLLIIRDIDFLLNTDQAGSSLVIFLSLDCSLMSVCIICNRFWFWYGTVFIVISSLSINIGVPACLLSACDFSVSSGIYPYSVIRVNIFLYHHVLSNFIICLSFRWK